jgi:hypothetical protein
MTEVRVNPRIVDAGILEKLGEARDIVTGAVGARVEQLGVQRPASADDRLAAVAFLLLPIMDELETRARVGDGEDVPVVASYGGVTGIMLGDLAVYVLPANAERWLDEDGGRWVPNDHAYEVIVYRVNEPEGSGLTRLWGSVPD